MDRLEVFGARKLKGKVNISGSKNAALPILAATILSNKKIILKNLPNVKDIETMIKLLQSIGSIVKYSKQKNLAIIHNKNKLKTFAGRGVEFDNSKVTCPVHPGSNGGTLTIIPHLAYVDFPKQITSTSSRSRNFCFPISC